MKVRFGNDAMPRVGRHEEKQENANCEDKAQWMTLFLLCLSPLEKRCPSPGCSPSLCSGVHAIGVDRVFRGSCAGARLPLLYASRWA
jgi:hypothetical protein